MSRFIHFWKIFPFKTMIFLGLLCFVVVERDPQSKRIIWQWGMTSSKINKAEFYPFSSFSMYSDFSARPFYMWLADQDGKPFPTNAMNRRVAVQASEVKKIYERKLKALDNRLKLKTTLQEMDPALKRECGMETLKVLRESMASADFARRYPGLRLSLHEVTITMKNGQLLEQDVNVAHE